MANFKNDNQIRFADLIQSMAALGWKPAHVAGVLKISRASVSKILTGKQTPRDGTVAALEALLERVSERQSASALRDEGARSNSSAEAFPAGELNDALRDLQEIAAADPGSARQIVEIVRTYKRALRKPEPRPSSVQDQDLADAVASIPTAERVAADDIRARQQKPPAGGPSGGKVRPSGAVSSHPSRSRGLPKRVPTEPVSEES
ncbi:MAG TPA: helix-turn-helix transcriptional regulator [Verrucomicrobiae bacterium]|nr:helix-turn-helix transcriptional regulator [Verrucomicrobiae bacterium]